MYQGQSETVIVSEKKVQEKKKSSKTLPFYSGDNRHRYTFFLSMNSNHLVCMMTILIILILIYMIFLNIILCFAQTKLSPN